MGKKSITLIAGQAHKVAGGNYFKLTDTVYPVTVSFFRAGQELSTERAENVEAGFGANPTPSIIVGPDGRVQPAFDYALIQSSNAQTISYHSTQGRVTDDRTTGTIQMVDGSKAIVLAGNAFIGASSFGALAANYNHHQIYNPVGSGFRVVVTDIHFSDQSTAATQALIYGYSTALATTVSNPRNKLVGGATDSVAEIRKVQAASALAGDLFLQLPVEAVATVGGSKSFKFEKPLVLKETKGLMVVNSTVNHADRVQFEYSLEAI